MRGVLAALLVVFLSGCVVPAVVVGQKALQSALSDRTFKSQFEDTKIHAGLLREYLRVDSGLPVDVGTDVWEGRVLLTGVVDAESKRAAVVRAVESDRRIRAFYNHIAIGTPEEVERNRREAESSPRAAETPPAAERDIVKVGRLVSDVWIETKIKTQLLATEAVRSVNYRWQSVRNKVYIIGRARSQAELDLVVRIIRQTRGVLEFTHYVEIKPAGQK